MKIAIVVPCHVPPSEAWIAALKAEAEANKADVLIVDDSDGNLGALPESWQILGYKVQEDFLGEDYAEFARLFHKSSACRIFGHLYAYSFGADVVIGLDSDCIVEKNFVRDHTQFLGKPFGSGWFNPIGYPNYTRGYPYSQRGWPVVANMGLWKNVLDINGKDRKENEPKDVRLIGSTIPNGYFPFSGMNFALAREAIPFFLFLPNFKNNEDDFRRIDDVWGGYIFQKFLRMNHQSTMLGFPIVFHDTVVVAEEDAAEEAAMYKYEDQFLMSVDVSFEEAEVVWGKSSPMECFEAFLKEFKKCDGAFGGLYPAFELWIKLLQKHA